MLRKSCLSVALFCSFSVLLSVPDYSMAQQSVRRERAWKTGETPAQAARRVVTAEQTVTVNGADRRVKKGESISVGGGNVLRVEIGNELTLQDGTRILKDGTIVLPNGTATTVDGTTILPDGREVRGSQRIVIEGDTVIGAPQKK